MDRVKALLPLNWTIIGNPVNWAVVILMLAFAGVALALIIPFNPDTTSEE